MEVINNRYRIINNLKQNRLCSIYEAMDLQKGCSIVKLYILNSKYIHKDFIDFCTLNLESLGSINNPYSIEIIEFGIVKQVDNKKSYNRTYYYTTEFMEEDKKILSAVERISEEILIKCFINICMSIKYFWTLGKPYSSLTVENIYVRDSNYGVKFKDIITIELEKNEFSSVVDISDLFMAPEQFKGEAATIGSQVYSLGVILIIMLLKSKAIYENESQVIDIINSFNNCKLEEYNHIFDEKFQCLIKKMVGIDPKGRYESIETIIEDINFTWGTNYKFHNKRELQKLNFDIKMIGREEEVSSLLTIKDSIFKYNLPKKVAAVHGEVGIGKTRLLKYIQYVLGLNEDNIYYSFNTSKASGKYSSTSLSDILRQIIPIATNESVNRYISDLVKFVPELAEKKNIVVVDYLKGNKEKYRVISKLASFLIEFFADKQGVIIIDDLDKADEFTLDFLFYLINKYSKGSKVMILFSYCDGECLENKKFMEFLSNARDNVRLELLLKPFNINQTGLMIKEILNMDKIPVKFTDSIYKHTMGNPLFIEETLKDVFAREIIYIDENEGKWFKQEDYKFILPQNMHEAYKNQTTKLDNVSYDILSTISIFENPVSIQVIGEFINEDTLKISFIIDELIAKGLLCRKIEDRGFVYEFYNKFLKAYIYESIDKQKKKEKHSLATNILKNYYEEDDRSYINELIYHLEKSEQYGKLLYYYIENSEIMISLKNRIEAISNLSKAIKVLDKENLEQEAYLIINKLNLFIRIGDLYIEEGEEQEALIYYKEAENLSSEGKCKKKQVDIIFKILAIIFLRGEEKEVNYYVEKAKLILDTINYTEGQINYLRVLSRKYYTQQNYDESCKIYFEAINLCGEKYIKDKVMLNSFYSNLLISQNKIDEAIKHTNICLEQCYIVDYKHGIINCINNLGIIYSDYLQNYGEALKYFKKIYEISREFNNKYDEIIALSNIGFIYYTLHDYNKAYDYFINATNNAKKYDYNNMAFYDYTYLGNIFYKFGNYGEAYRYYLFCQEQLEKRPNQGQEIGPYYLLGFRINFEFNNNDAALECLEKASKVYENSDVMFTWELQTLKLIAELLICKNYNKNISKELIKVSEKVNDVDEKINMLYESIIVLLDHGYISEAKDIHKYIDDCNFKCESNRTLCLKLYLDTILSGKSGIDSLIKSIELCKKHEQCNILWKIYSQVGDYYYKKREYSYAAAYYFECCGVIADLVLQVPKEYRVNFINSNKMIRFFERFMAIESYFENKKSKFELNNLNISISDEKDIEKLFNSLNNSKILKNKYFMKSLKKLWAFTLQEDIHDIVSLVNKLSVNSMKSMEIITQYISSITLATKASIIIETNKKFQVLVSSNEDKELPKDLSMIHRCRDLLKPIIIKDNFLENLSIKSSKIDIGSIRAAMCIPILMDSKINLTSGFKRDSDIYNYNDDILGYIYVESERILNNINEDTLNDCNTLMKILGIILDKYNTKINSTIDKLTGTLTRKQLEKLIQNEMDRSSEVNSQFSLIMFDIDKFKNINDTFGHRTGDKVLKELCQIVISNIRHTDVIGRYGGEEFIVILPDTDVKGAEEVAEKIRMKIQESRILGDKRNVTISLGISNYPQHTIVYEELIERADQALYAAKNSGRNTVKVWNENYSLKGNTTNKLSGILTGSTNQDFRNVSTLVEIVDLVNEDISFEGKIYNVLGKLIEVTESENVALFLVKEEEIAKSFGRKQFSKEWCGVEAFGENTIHNVISSGENVCSIDWDNINDIDSLSIIPDWKSIMIIPLKKANKVIAVLCLSASSEVKEFNGDELNFISTLGKIITTIL
jgi:diguanylate cyclase (GGDEF)-like protein